MRDILVLVRFCPLEGLMYVLPNVKAEEDEELTLTLGKLPSFVFFLIQFCPSQASLGSPQAPRHSLPTAHSICLTLPSLSPATKLPKSKTPKNTSTNHIFRV
jgi:hypothetical protein